MPKSALRWLMISAIIIGFNASGWAQETTMQGKTAYLSSCAPCHGADGKGKRISQHGAQDAACRPDNARQEERWRISDRCGE